MTQANTRIYKVTTPAGIRLIEAANKSQAIGHVAKTTITATVTTTKELAQMFREDKGVTVEQAGGEAGEL